MKKSDRTKKKHTITIKLAGTASQFGWLLATLYRTKIFWVARPLKDALRQAGLQVEGRVTDNRPATRKHDGEK